MNTKKPFELSDNDFEPPKKSLFSSIVNSFKSGVKALQTKSQINEQKPQLPNLFEQNVNFQPGTNQLFVQQHSSRPQMTVIPAKLFLAYKNVQQQQILFQQNQKQKIDDYSEKIKQLQVENQKLLDKAEQMRVDYIRMAKNAEITVLKLATKKEVANLAQNQPEAQKASSETNGTSTIEVKTIQQFSQQTSEQKTQQNFTFGQSSEKAVNSKQFTFGQNTEKPPNLQINEQKEVPKEAPKESSSFSLNQTVVQKEPAKFTFGQVTQKSDEKEAPKEVKQFTYEQPNIQKEPVVFSFGQINAAQKVDEKVLKINDFSQPDTQKQPPKFTFGQNSAQPVVNQQKPVDEKETPKEVKPFVFNQPVAQSEPLKFTFGQQNATQSKPDTQLSFGMNTIKPSDAPTPAPVFGIKAAPSAKSMFNFNFSGAEKQK